MLRDSSQRSHIERNQPQTTQPPSVLSFSLLHIPFVSLLLSSFVCFIGFCFLRADQRADQFAAFLFFSSLLLSPSRYCSSQSVSLLVPRDGVASTCFVPRLIVEDGSIRPKESDSYEFMIRQSDDFLRVDYSIHNENGETHHCCSTPDVTHHRQAGRKAETIRELSWWTRRV